MIHLSNDLVECGGFHYDEELDNKHLTCWIPITNYDYSALSFFKFNNKRFKKFWLLISKYNFLNFFLKKIFANKGNIFFWDGHQIHSGEKNISTKISCAVQFKITKDVYKYEQNKKLNIKFEKGREFRNLNKKEILEEFKKYVNYIQILKKKKNNINIFNFIESILKNVNKPSLRLSFSFSLFSQRLLSKKIFFPKFKNYIEVCHMLDLLSLSFGSSNMISLYRLIDAKLVTKKN